MATRRARTTRTLAAPGDPLLVGAAVPLTPGAPQRPRRQGAGQAAARAGLTRHSVLGLRLPRLGTARRPRWPRVVVAVIAVYAAFLTAQDLVRLGALDRQIAAVDAQVAQVDAKDAVLRMQAAGLENPKDIADTARKWLGLAAPGDVVFTPVPPAH